jgi:3-oxoacyl-(acyl-carrier-protein) synthase
MRGVRVAGTGAVTALGLGREPTWRGLIEGQRALAGTPPMGRVDRDAAARLLATRRPEWARRASSPEEVLLALAASELPPERPTAVVMGSTKGPPHALARFVASLVGAEGPVLGISQACASATAAIAHGAALVATGQHERVVVGGVEALSPFVADGFGALQALDARGARPFDRARAGLSLGEAAAVLLLEAAPPGPGTWLRGWGSASDASHPTSPDREGRGLERALRAALARAGIEPGAVAFACAHGTGTERNDPAELHAYERVFAATVPVFSIKGHLGHALGAAGALDALTAILGLERGRIPGTAGLEQPLACGVRLPARAETLDHPRVAVSANAGFGGLNAALVFEVTA